MNAVLRIENLSKKYPKTQQNEEKYALKNISFEAQKGELIGIIGRNGAGKSTLLRIIAKITKQNEGYIKLNGRITALLSLGATLQKELNAKDNILFYGAMMGFSRQQVMAQYEKIVQFTEISHNKHTPIKHYSTGMQMRLAFAMAVFLANDIILIDEIFLVGDAIYQQKGVNKLLELIQNQKTVLFVTHQMALIQQLSDRVLWLEEGKLMQIGEPTQVIKSYSQQHLQAQDATVQLNNLTRSHAQKSELIFSKIVFNKTSYQPNEECKISFYLEKKADKAFQNLHLSFGIFDFNGLCIYHFSNLFVHQPIDIFDEKQYYEFQIPQIQLKSGKYTLNLHLIANNELQDWLQQIVVLEIQEGNIYQTILLPKGVVQPSFFFHIKEKN
ncbi:MAG: ATP-binding cassette domain-containing protein [Cytophagales bacterium]|nr:MAG: ATP-binding cassette domain-containing protein [Cytophagales bacterium]